MSILWLIAILPLATTLGVCLAWSLGSRQFVRGFVIAGSCAAACLAGQLTRAELSTQRLVLIDSLLPVSGLGGGDLLGISLVCNSLTATLLMVLSVATLSLAWWGQQRVSTLSLVLLQALYSANVWMWLVDQFSLVFVLQGITLSLGVVLLAGSSATSKSMVAGRSLWIAVTLTDLGLLVVAILWMLGAGVTTISSTGDSTLVREIALRSPVLVETLGACLCLGIWGRLALFPLGQITEAMTTTSSWVQGVLTCFVMGSVGWRWVVVAEPWWATVPDTREWVLLLASLAGVMAGWFAICARDLRARSACLTTLAWSGALLILMNPATSAPHERAIGVATWVWVATTLASTWLMAAWREASTDSFVPEPSRSSGGMSESVEWSWSGKNSGTTFSGYLISDSRLPRAFQGPAEPLSGEFVTTARGGRMIVVPGLLGLFVPLWLSGADFSQSTWCWLAAAWTLGTHAATCMILEVHTAEGTGRRWMLGILASAGAIVVAGIWLNLGSMMSPPTLHSLDLIVPMGSLLAGVISGLLSGRISSALPTSWMACWYGLGAHRLFMSVLIRICLNWPIRACAQFCRLLDSMVFGGGVPRFLLALSSSGDEDDPSSTGLDPAFQALSLCVVTVVVMLTLVLQQP